MRLSFQFRHFQIVKNSFCLGFSVFLTTAIKTAPAKRFFEAFSWPLSCLIRNNLSPSIEDPGAGKLSREKRRDESQAISTDPTDCSCVSKDEIISRTFSKPRAILDERNRNFIFLPHVREYGFRNPEVRYFCLWNPKSGKILLVESGIIGFGIRNTAQKIRNPTNN